MKSPGKGRTQNSCSPDVFGFKSGSGFETLAYVGSMSNLKVAMGRWPHGSGIDNLATIDGVLALEQNFGRITTRCCSSNSTFIR